MELGMDYIHNVRLNFSVNEHSPCNVFDYFSWSSVDLIELYTKLYIVKVSDSFFDYAIFGLNELPVSFWRYVKNKSVCSRSFCDVSYACVLTDGNRVMAIDTPVGYFHAAKKSKLSFEDESIVLEKSVGLDVNNFKIGKVSPVVADILRISNDDMIGLTRCEVFEKIEMLERVDKLKELRDVNAMKYYLKEFDHSRFSSIDLNDVDTLFSMLESCILDGWSESHSRVNQMMNVSYGIVDI